MSNVDITECNQIFVDAGTVSFSMSNTKGDSFYIGNKTTGGSVLLRSLDDLILLTSTLIELKEEGRIGK